MRDFYAPCVYNAHMDCNAYAKVNLTLDIAGKRADGYHDLRTVMLAIDLFDELSLTFSSGGIKIEAEPALPEGSAAFRAASAYADACGCPGVHARIVRNIPPEAGLGGSSADAAAILLAMQDTYRALDEKTLLSLAAGIGSDVPFCMAGGLALCEGRGERITRLPFLPLTLLIVKPQRGASTRAVFAGLRPPYPQAATDGAVCAIRRADRTALLAHIGNGLTDAACSLVPEIADLLARMRGAGAQAASMTGSGSAVFGVFPDEAAANNARSAFCDLPFARVCRAHPFVV